MHVFNHGIHRIYGSVTHGRAALVAAVLGFAFASFAAEPTISVEARQRYPWNGLVDLNFTITGTSGTKYDTFFTAKDMVGNTNIAMRTIRKADGTAAAATEPLLPGTYSWVWDAVADLTVDRITHDGFLTTSSTTLFTNRSLSTAKDFSIIFGGASITVSEMTNGNAYNIKTDGNGKSIQFQIINGGYLKCLCVHVEQSGNDIVGYVKWARYMAETFPLGTDFDSTSYTAYSIATSSGVTGYGVSSITATFPNLRHDVRFDRVTVTGTAVEPVHLYMVIDLSSGSSSSSYPVSCLDAVPSGGWSDTYKTTKLVLRRIEPGSFVHSPSKITLTNPYYIGIFEVTQKQYSLIVGSNPSKSTGNMRPVENISYNTLRGSSKGSQWPTSTAVDLTSFFGKLRSRVSLEIDMPTQAQWEYACRAGTTTTYSFGNSANGNYMWYNSNSSGATHEVGTKTPNAWGLYDMHGNVWEWCLDWAWSMSNNGDQTDPVGFVYSNDSGHNRIRRGGSFREDASCCTSSYQNSNILPTMNGFPAGDTGFRVCLTIQ